MRKKRRLAEGCEISKTARTSFRENSLPRDNWMARSTDCIGAPNVLASSRAPAQADIETRDVNSTNNVLIGTPSGFPVTSQFACRMRRPLVRPPSASAQLVDYPTMGSGFCYPRYRYEIKATCHGSSRNIPAGRAVSAPTPEADNPEFM